MPSEMSTCPQCSGVDGSHARDCTAGIVEEVGRLMAAGLNRDDAVKVATMTSVDMPPLASNRWAAFTDDELETLSAGIEKLHGEWRDNRLRPMWKEIVAELDRRRTL